MLVKSHTKTIRSRTLFSLNSFTMKGGVNFSLFEVRIDDIITLLIGSQVLFFVSFSQTIWKKNN